MSAYDDLYRLTKATGTALSRPGVVDRFKTTYAFDEIHNMKRLDQKHWLTTANDATNETAHPPHTNHDFDYAYGGVGPHQATKIGDRNLVYDANGNTERECRDHGDPTCSVNANKLRRYFWGEENELTAVIDGGGWNVTRFIYDAGGQRVVKLGRGGESITVGQFFALKGRKAATKHVFIGETRLASKLLPSPGWEPSWSTGTAPAGPITTVDTTSGCDPSTYQPQKCPIAPAANPVLDRRPDTTKIKPETYYYHSDHLGSTSWVTDQNGRVHEHVDYFPYGEVWRSPRYDSDGDPTHRQQFLFSAKEMDEETGLYYFGARYLDPVRARWVNTDPAFTASPGLALTRLREMNVYGYAALSPVVLGDPDGRCAALGGMRVSCSAPGIEAMKAGASEAFEGWRAGNIFAMTTGSAMTAVGLLSAAAGSVIDATVGFAWNSGVDYGSGVDTLVQTGGKDSGTLLRGSAGLLTISAGARLSGPASAGPPQPKSGPPSGSAAPANEGGFAGQMDPAEAARYERYWQGLTERAPVQAQPYEIIPRYTSEGQVGSYTTYDRLGYRAYQYEVDAGARHGPGYHAYDQTPPVGAGGRGPRGPHVPF